MTMDKPLHSSCGTQHTRFRGSLIMSKTSNSNGLLAELKRLKKEPEIGPIPGLEVRILYEMGGQTFGYPANLLFLDFTEGEREFTFRFIDLVQDFPTEETKITPLKAKELASNPFNKFRIIQRNDRGSLDISGRFAIVDQPILDYLDLKESEGHKEEKKKWKMGVGIGVGIGVPLLLAVAFFMGRLMGRKRGQTQNRPVKRVESH